MYQDLRCPVPGSLVTSRGGGEKGGEFELSTSVRSPGRSGCNMTWARGQSMWAKVTLPPANGVAAQRPRLGVVTLPRNPHPSSRSPSGGRCQSLASGSQKWRRRCGRRGIFTQRKDQGRPIPHSPLRFSVDNLSWPLRSGELCSRALGQDPGWRPPLGRGRGVEAGRGPRAPRRANQGSQAARGAQPRAATLAGEPRPPAHPPRAASSTPCWAVAGPRRAVPLLPAPTPSSHHP